MPDEQTYVGALRELAAKTERLRSAMDAQEWEQLLIDLEERQELMDRIGQMQQNRAHLSEEERADAARLLEQMIVDDQALTGKLEEALSSNRDAMQEHELTRATLSAYRRTARPIDHELRARFIDKQR